MAIDIKLNTDADLSGVDKLADGLDDATKAAEKLEKADADKLERSLDDAAGTSDDLTDALKDAERAADKLGDEKTSLKKIDDAADDAAKTIDRDLTQALKEAAQQADKTGKQAKESIGTGMQGGSEAGAEAMDELSSNWGETMSSFDGSAQSMVSIVADTFGGLAGSMAIGGPLGSLFLGGAAGIIAATVTKWSEGSDKIEARNKAMYDAMLENANAYFTNEQIVERFNNQINGTDDADMDASQFNRIVTATGLSREDVALAVADPKNNGRAVSQALTQAQESAWDKADTAERSAKTTNRAGVNEYKSQATAIDKDAAAWEAYSGQVESTSRSVKTNSAYLREHGLLADDDAEKSRDLATAQADSADAFTTAKDAIKDNIEGHKSAGAAWTDNQAALSDLTDSLLAEQDALSDTGASSSDLTALQKEQAEQFIETAGAAGKNRDQAIDLAESLGLIPSDVATQLRQTGAAEAQLQASKTKQAFGEIPESILTKINLTIPSATEREQAVRTLELGMRAARIALTITQSRMEI